MTDRLVPGNCISVYYKNREVFTCSSGYADIEGKIPMSGDKYINIYSCTKISTVIAALQLYEKGLFSLDDPLYDFMPEFKNMTVKDKDGNIKKAENTITLKHLFTMTAGFNYNFNTPGIGKAREETNGKMDTVKTVRRFAEGPLSFEPGTDWLYSVCHDILAGVVEIVSGIRFSEYCEKNIFEPLDIDARFHITEDISGKMATQYEFKTATSSDDIVKNQILSPSGEGVIIKNNKNSFRLGPAYDSGGAGIVTTVPEYAKLADALANDGIGATGERIISKGSIGLMCTDQLDENLRRSFNWPQVRGFSYGLGVRTPLPGNPYKETGWGGAAGAFFSAYVGTGFSYFYAHHMLNPQAAIYQPALRAAAETVFKELE